MRRFSFAFIALLLAACETVDTHTIVKGPIWLVSRNDIQAAIAAARQSEPELRTRSIGEVIVHSRDEIHVVIGYTGYAGTGQWAVVKRKGLQWRYITSDSMIVTE